MQSDPGSRTLDQMPSAPIKRSPSILRPSSSIAITDVFPVALSSVCTTTSASLVQQHGKALHGQGYDILAAMHTATACLDQW